MNKQITFFGGSILPFVHAHYLERTYFEPFFKLVLICASFIFFLEGKGNLPPPFLPLFGKRSTIYLSNVFRTPHSNCTYVFINIYFCWDIFFFLVSSFFYWKDITSDFLKMLFSILVCGVPVWTCSLKIGGVSAILIKMGVFWGGGWCKSSFTHKNEIYPRTLQNK